MTATLAVHTMKAIVQDRYGSTDALRLADIDKPTIKDNEVLVSVRAAALNPLDWFALSGGMGRPFFGITRPRIRVRGVDVAGYVAAVGPAVTRFAPGDAVYGGCNGALAEFAATKESNLARKPANLSFEQAAAVPVAGLTALRAMRDVANLQRGQKVLINGAAGGVGHFAVQIARALDGEVTGVCSTPSVDLVQSLGAAYVIDYTREDYTRGGKVYDVILDNIGNHSLSENRKVASPDGTVIFNSGKAGFGPIIQLFLMKSFVRQKLRFFIARFNTADLDVLRDLIESGKVTPTIDSTYALADSARALARLGTGHAHGKVVVTM
jgi:NADPH:quinone reductase-like Zn-dependent oxidoreductase